MSHHFGRLVLFLLLGFGVSLSVFAQSTAQFQGRVTDPQQGVVAGAEVRIVNQETGVEQKVTTNKDGLYTAPFLSPGTYVVTVQAPGFATASSNPLTLTVGQTQAFDVRLKVGNTNQTVTVNGSAIQMNTTDGSVSTVIDQTFVANIPLNGRSIQDLIDLTPGVTTTSPNEDSQMGVSGDFSVNGQRTESNNYIVDGITANFSAGNGGAVGDAGGNVPAVSALGTSQALFSLDDLQEFRVLSSSYSAEYGRATGGQFIFLTRSGTNALHGSLYDYLRNGAFDANNWFNNSLGLAKTSEQQNDFGGTFGGPVRIPWLYNGKDKTFFFFSYEGLRLIQPQAASTTSVPDLDLRANAVASIQPILNAYPLPNLPEEMVPCSGTTFSNATPYPCPSGAATGTQVPSGVAEFARAYSVPSSLNAYSGRLDHNFSPKMSAFFRFSVTPSDSETRQGGFSDITAFNSYTDTYTLGITNQLSSNINNSFRLGYGSNSMYTNGYLDSFGGATPINYFAAAGIAGYPNPEPDTQFGIPGTIQPSFFIKNVTQESNQWNLVDTVSITKGHHQLKFGFDYRRVSSLVGGYNPLVEVDYTNAWQIQNDLANSFETIAYQPGAPLFKEYALFAQDEWRVAPRLSLSIGLRWDVDGPPTQASGQDAFTLTGSLGNPSSLALAPRGTALWQTPYLNFAPRLGVAYQVLSHPGWETVLRSGGGVFFDNDDWLGTAAYEGLGFYGFYTCPPVTCGYPATAAQIAADIPPTTAPYTSTSLFYFPAHMQLPYSLQWNLSVQQSLGTAQSFTLSYVGASGRRLPNLQYFSLHSLNPNFATVISDYGGIHSNYNSLQASFQRKLSHGVQALASYTWSHSLDDISEGIGLNIGQREFPPQYGNSDFDLRQNFVAAVSWDLPAVNHDSITKAALSNWGLDVHFVARSGFPVQVTGTTGTDPTTGLAFYSGVILNQSVPLYLYGANCTAYYIAHGNPNHGGTCPGGRAVNPAAYTATGSLSNPAPKNYARGFGENQINTALRRDLPIRENLKLQFRAELFNILNHPNFGSISGSVGSSNFGLATATLNNSLATVVSQYQQGGPRSMQFALKLIF